MPGRGEWSSGPLTALKNTVLSIGAHALLGWLLLLPLAVLGVLAVSAFASLEDARRAQRVKEGRSPDATGNGMSFVPLIAWLPAALFLILPVLTYLAITFLLGGLLRGAITALHPERAARLGERKNPHSLREIALRPTRWTISLLRRAVPRDSMPGALAVTLDNQLAFFEMQRKAVEAGEQGGEIVSRIVTGLRELEADAALKALEPAVWNPRVHFVGHSFGASVVLNAVRRLAYMKRTSETRGPVVQSVSLLQGAVASGWLNGENDLQNLVEGAIACGYSGYDTANGFYYPFSNNSRMAAGYVGFYRDAYGHLPIILGLKGEYASLVSPPKLAASVENIRKWRSPTGSSRPAATSRRSC